MLKCLSIFFFFCFLFLYVYSDQGGLNKVEVVTRYTIDKFLRFNYFSAE